MNDFYAMRFIFNIIFALSVWVLTGCASDKQMVGNDGNVTTVVIPKPVDSKHIDVISDLDYIILEAKENAYLGFVSKLRIHRNKIYVLDDRHANALFIYTMEGKHIATIGDKRGRGPQDFVELSNFEIDYVNNQILTMDNFGHKFMIYDLDGNFIKQVGSDIYVSNAVLLPNGHILHAISPDITFLGKEKILVVDENRRIVKRKFEYEINENINFSIQDIIRSQFDGSFNFSPAFRDTIYTIDERLEIIPKYAINYGDNKHLSKKTLKRLRSIDELREIAKGGSIWFMGNNVESEDFLYFRMGILYNEKYVFYDKRANRAIAISCDARPWQYKYYLYRLLCSDEDGYFYGSLNSAMDVDNFFKLLPEKPKIDTTEELNPILFRYKLNNAFN